MIGNAHLDPVWFWRWPVGVASALATCRTAVELMDEYPEFEFTRSDVWLYEQIERLDPPLFERIRRLIADGRWHVVGGWYIQPDCNIPLGESFRRHTEIGLEYGRTRLGVTTSVGYNVDSFGHAASIPDILSSYGYNSYVMMRPGPHEMDLPGSLFEWEGPRGGRLTTWRIHEPYNSKTPEQLEAHISEILESCVTAGVDHVMCFYGVGDHGGGPTRSELEWIRAHRDRFRGARLEFSNPRRFFDAVRAGGHDLPVVRGELQYHAIGCYSVMRDIKTSLRRAESGLASADTLAARYGDRTDSAPEEAARQAAWRHTLFNQFHDILAGSSVRSACVDARDQLGHACNTAFDQTSDIVLRRLLRTAPHELQRIGLINPTTTAFDGLVAHEPWLEWTVFEGALVDESGTELPYQVVRQEAISGPRKCLLFPLRIGPDEVRLVYLDHRRAPQPADGALEATPDGLRSRSHRVELLPDRGGFRIGATRTAGRPETLCDVRLVVYEDLSDTWSHFIGGYRDADCVGGFTIGRSVVEEAGPLRATLVLDCALGSSRATFRVRLFDDGRPPRIDLRLDWAEYLRIAKLELRIPAGISRHIDGIPGDVLERPANGREFPMRDLSCAIAHDGSTLTAVAPEVFAVDADAESLALTLVRSPAYAWQGRKVTLDREALEDWTDQGSHDFAIALLENAPLVDAERIALHMRRPPVAADLTHGMKASVVERSRP